MYLKSAFNTMERIIFPIALVDMSTVGAFLTGISWVNSNNRFSNGFSLISQKLFKLVETPIVKFSSKLNSSGSALNSYAGKVFNSKYIKRHSCNFLRDVVIHPGYKPFFFSANLPEKFFSGSSAFALKFRSKVCVLCSYVLDMDLLLKKSLLEVTAILTIPLSIPRTLSLPECSGDGDCFLIVTCR